MRVREAILKRLRESPNGAVEQAIEAVLPEAVSREQLELTDVLLARGRRAGWITLVRGFDKLPAELQDHLLHHPRDLFGPLSDTMEDDEGNARANVIEIVRKAADPKLVFLLTEALSDVRPEVRELASEAILEAIRRYRKSRFDAAEKMGREGTDLTGGENNSAEGAGPNPPDPEHLRRAVEFGLRQYKTHRSANIILAALLFERQQDSPIWSSFMDAHDESTRTAVQFLRQLDQPALASAAFLALASPLKAATQGGLSACEDGVMATALAQESYRLIDPVLGARAAGIAHFKMFALIPSEAPWTDKTWLDYFRLVEAVTMTAEHRLEWLKKFLETAPRGPGMRPAKMLVLRAIAGVRAPEAMLVILPVTCDPDEIVARSATRYILHRRPADWRTGANTILQSPHDSVRKLVSQAISPGQFERLWHDYLKLPPAVQVLSTRALSETDIHFNELLRTKLTSREPVENAQGLKMLLTLLNLKPFREQIVALCAHADPRLAATAVRLIGRLEDPGLRDVLEIAAKHADPRVRANAVEAMDQLRVADRSQEVLTMLHSRFNRERANAIRAISNTNFSTARECLLKMLGDASPQHRVSALWVVGQLSLLEVVRQVGSMARRDPNRHVRSQAQEVLKELEEAANAFTADSMAL